ncbi:hypothetical protein [Actinomycetospora sp. TBRC 11914]|uniref:hypothetical protein n=1 Tax=Actinomycetospora sp. TBRC 11914 TaxID=2729387 RepID=UPI00145FBB46|nr:hypothetical protein [Actinomycetospora sp. TBRC 11914]NMO91355.1 hypothetical protein [Actinomycetospora sp. TBRC 11914]
MTRAGAGRPEAPALVAGIDVDRVAAAACPLVVGLHPGPHGTAATLLPRRRVDGVVVTDDGPGPARIAVTVTACFGAPLRRVVEQVRSAVAVRAPGHPVDVTCADVA